MAGYSERIQLGRWEWPGSKKKIRNQIRSGKARMSQRKAPGKYLGVKAHPLRPHDSRTKLPNRGRCVWLFLRVDNDDEL